LGREEYGDFMGILKLHQFYHSVSTVINVRDKHVSGDLKMLRGNGFFYKNLLHDKLFGHRTRINGKKICRSTILSIVDGCFRQMCLKWTAVLDGNV
jgi:hypothetical protein